LTNVGGGLQPAAQTAGLKAGGYEQVRDVLNT
jgi:hypothetical protein